ncbi:hypothetical protein P8452_04612 [Trifolium repens]|nr:hypothetical protein P8452_04612 [Trifolium repens]
MASSRRINYATNRGGFLTAYIHGETLKKNFADYVRATKFKTVILIGPLGDEIECKLLIKTTKMKKSVKIGEGWMEFVERNGFNKGDILNFKFINKQEHNLVNVFQYQP